VFCGLNLYHPATVEWGTDGKSAADMLSLISPSTQVINIAREGRKRQPEQELYITANQYFVNLLRSP
jgi:hypothetical protein